MGVNGLWRLLEPSGKPVPVETLENQVLAVDVSIWLHQATKGFQDATGNALPNAHLLGLFHRLCKLLFYKIKPVFVFDGGIPHLKKQTVAARRQQKGKAEQTAERMREKLLQNLIKHSAVKNVLGSQSGQSEVFMPRVRSEDDMFQLPPPSQTEQESDSGSESAEETRHHHKYNDLHTLDVNSAHFRSLPADVRHDILVELKETRKQSSWGRLHELPKESNDFSSYQMKRLLKRRSVQVSLEEAEKEMGGKTLSLGELEELMADNGIVTDSLIGKRIASDSTKRFIYINGSKIETSPIKDGKSEEPGSSDGKPVESNSAESSKNETSTSAAHEVYELFSDEDYEDYEGDYIDDEEWTFRFSDEEMDDKKDLPRNLKAAKNFMFENSGLTQAQILAIIRTQNKAKKSDSKNAPLMNAPSTSKVNLEESKISCGGIPDKPTNIAESKVNVANLSALTDLQEKTKEGGHKRPANMVEREVIQVASDSDSDAGFVEVDDLPASNIENESRNSSGNTDDNPVTKSEGSSIRVTKNGTSLEVLIQPNNLEMGDDIFADVFSKCSDEKPTTADASKPRTVECLGKGSSLEVIIQPDNCEIEDDIFADIFSNPSGEVQNNTDEISKSTDLKSLKNKDAAEIFSKKGVVPTDNRFVSKSETNISNKECSSVIDVKSKLVQDKFTTKVPENINAASSAKLNTSLSDKDRESYSNEFKTMNPVKLQSVDLTSSSASLDAEKKQDFMNTSTVTSLTHVTSTSTVKPQYSGDLEDIIEEEDGSDSDSYIDVPEPMPKLVLDSVTSEKLQRLQTSLEDEHYRLMVERGKQDRLAANITDQMYSEAQELLRLFGVPYIVAPMEAEAQCAFLDAIALTDGTITDDSDIWLFGGQQVYKNFFNQKKHVMRFKAADIQHYFKLSRQEMILLALLVGSDYTVGLQGIGPVTALEILAAFPPSNAEGDKDEKEQLISSLQNFRNWWASGKAASPVKLSLKNKIKDIRIHAGFPSSAVVEAYLHPKVDDSSEKFSWSSPDLTALRKFALEKFGWAQTKTDTILLPVIKKLDERSNQQTLDYFVRIKPKLPLPEGRVSKRVQSAIHRMGRESDSEDFDAPAPKVTKVKRGGGRGRAVSGETSRGNRRGVRGGNVGGRGRVEIGELSTASRERGLAEMREISLGLTRRPMMAEAIGRSRGRGVMREANRNQGRGKNALALARSGLNYEPPEENTPPSEFILQREKDKINSLKKKLKAIEVFRKSKLDTTKRGKRARRKVTAPNLSESSDSD